MIRWLSAALALALLVYLLWRVTRRRATMRCHWCGQQLGHVRQLRDPYHYAVTVAHLGVCPLAPPSLRRSVADMVPEDAGALDWARLRREVAHVGYLGGPHADPLTVHPAGLCEMCDAYPDLQERNGHAASLS